MDKVYDSSGWIDVKKRPITHKIKSNTRSLRQTNKRIFRTPSPKLDNINESKKLEDSPLDPHIVAEIKKVLKSPTFLATKHGATTSILEKIKKEAVLKPRCKSSRNLMEGYECDCCKGYYDTLGLDGKERKEYINKVSRHRRFEERPPTPPRYWDINAPSFEEQKEFGYVIESNSPLKKKKKMD